MAKIRLLLVDDHDVVRTGLRSYLETQEGILVVGEARSGAEALEETAATKPDIAIMDISMPGMDGLEATRLLTADPQVRSAVLMLTTFNRDDYLLEALRAGASGFLLKNSRPEQLVEAVRSVGAGDGLLAPEVTRAVIERALDGARRTPAPEDGELPAAVAALTERELEVLRFVARGLANDEIAAELVLGRATVKTHVSNVLMKLHLRDRVQAVVFAYEHGIVRTHEQ